MIIITKTMTITIIMQYVQRAYAPFNGFLQNLPSNLGELRTSVKIILSPKNTKKNMITWNM